MITLPLVLLFCFNNTQFFPVLWLMSHEPPSRTATSTALSEGVIGDPSSQPVVEQGSPPPGTLRLQSLLVEECITWVNKSNRDQPIKVKPVSKSKQYSLAQEKNRKLSNPLLRRLSTSSISMNLELPKLQRDGGVVSELNKKHLHQVDHLNRMMIEGHDHPRLNLVKLSLKRKRSMSPISLG